MPDIETGRLRIRTFQDGDLPEIQRILSLVFGPEAQPEPEQESPQRESWLRWSILSQEWLPKLHQPPYGDRAVVLKSTGALIGAAGYVPLLAPFEQIPELRTDGDPNGYYAPEVGLYWVIDPAHRRQGFASEAARALVDHGFRELQLRRILATTEQDNLASQGVMRRLGMIITRNPLPQPEWLQVVGVLDNPG